MRLTKRRLVIALIILLIAFLWFFVIPFYRFLREDLKISPFKVLLLGSKFQKIGDSINILVLGVPGEPHDGPYLSDSNLVVQYDFKKNRAITVSIPRDVWSNTLEAKINAAYALGEAKKKGGGLILAPAESGAIVGFPIEYAFVIDFAGFQKLIDLLGGVDVRVERSFVDRKYPIAGHESDDCGGRDPDFTCRYETIEFKAGTTHMDGKQALKFVRSRNATGVEGSDFARGKRQEKVTDAVKDKITGLFVRADVATLRKLYYLLNEVVSRSMSNEQAAALLKHILFSRHFYNKSFAIPQQLFEVPQSDPYGGQYVLVPKDSFDSIHTYVDCIVTTEDNKTCDRKAGLQNE